MKKSVLLCIVLVLFAIQTLFAGFDPALPASSTIIASYPAIIREQLRALKDDGIVNAGLLASATLESLAATDAANIDAAHWKNVLGLSDAMKTDGSNATQVVVLPGAILDCFVSVLKTDKDMNDVFVTTTSKDASGVVRKTSVLSGGASPEYASRTECIYDTDGVATLSERVFEQHYDAGVWIGETLSE
jgi:hypothetical protein